MLQSLQMALTQVKAFKTSEKLLNEIHSLYPAKQIIKKVYNNIGSSIKIQKKYKIDTIFVNSKNSEKTDSNRQFINFQWKYT